MSRSQTSLPWNFASIDFERGLVLTRRVILPWQGANQAADGKPGSLRRYLKIYQLGTRRWVRGDLETPPGLESWADFRARVASGVDRLSNGDVSGQRIAAFTSGGATAAAVGVVLDLDDEKVLELSWRVSNGSLTELLFSGGRLALETFNARPHIREERLLPYI